MVLITLPTSDLPHAQRDARAKLTAAISDPITVVIVVQGNDGDARAAVEMCVARAMVKPGIRRVVWVPEPTLLTAAQQALFTPDNVRALSIGLDDKPAEPLTNVRARIRHFVERAFVKAENQGIDQ